MFSMSTDTSHGSPPINLNGQRSPGARSGCLKVAALGLCGLMASAHAADGSGRCSARSGATTPPIVELYTSEGCSSCPPADRWLSRLNAQPDVVALAFHVDYWDHLGWKDPYGSPVFSLRQAQQQVVNGARFSYTPQVAVNGVDTPGWRSLRSPIPAPQTMAPVQVQLSREGDRYTAVVQAVGGLSIRIGAYWAVTENALVSDVKRGENSGAFLTHDFVVREYRPVAPWVAAADSTKTLTLAALPAPEGSRPRQINLVLFDADTGRPVQAIKLGC
ncbi:MAG: hypothetical protein CFE40_04485 [Burkholderiales bacterium PBB1]|nr:MAG: hypothetical protein CFE40_04485 [Burkholderiales bacterium PBB1]